MTQQANPKTNATGPRAARSTKSATRGLLHVSDHNIMQKIRIKCPHCKVTLDVRNSTGAAEKEITCPNCNTNLMVKFKQPIAPPQPANTEAPTAPDSVYADSQAQTPAAYTDTSETMVTSLPIFDAIMGKLLYNGKKYTLQMGINTIGRKAETSKASLQIETDDRSMSRLHSVIKVTRLLDGTLRTTIENADNKNLTYVGGQLLIDGDTIVLNDGDVIKMGNAYVTFIKDILHI